MSNQCAQISLFSGQMTFSIYRELFGDNLALVFYFVRTNSYEGRVLFY